MTNHSVADHYDSSAENYHLQYDRSLLTDTSRKHPANFFRLQLLVNAFIEKGIKRVIEVGVGEGTPISTLAAAGIETAGFDISHNMVDKCRETLKSKGLRHDNIIWGDVQDPTSYTPLMADGQYDGLMAMGVMPHVRNDIQSLTNMRTMVRPGGSVFIEFRNKLFSLFTFNRYTYEFIMDDLLADVAPKMKKIVGENLKKRLEMDKPTPRVEHDEDADAPGYDAILSKFHNPFEVLEMFEQTGFEDAKLLWYHYHPAMPYLTDEDKTLFRDEALKLEHEASGWRGMFLCSAFVVEAVKADDGLQY